MKEKVFVGLSGGVDSSVAAKRLLERGYDVVGVFIKTWHPDFITCTEASDRLDAMRVAAHLNIPFLTCDATATYKEDVAEYMIQEYAKGRTPNPDVMCNRYVKFGAFLDFARAHGAAYIATGHYARVEEENGVKTLCRGTDPEKDQSYFLWTLTDNELTHVLFPIGNSTKQEVRAEALLAGLPVATKRDSQGVCFLGAIDMESFLSHYIPQKLGKVVNQEGHIVGTHTGATFYTLGQRHGFTITDPAFAVKPLYVVSKDIPTNTLVVGAERKTQNNLMVVLEDSNIRYVNGVTYDAQFRYRQKPFKVTVTASENGRIQLAVCSEGVEEPSPGQSAVVYSGNVCIGGGIIEEVL